MIPPETNLKANIETYQANYLADYHFESIMVSYRSRLLVERLNFLKPQVVLEIGCGSELLYKKWIDNAEKVWNWVIVEPANHFADIAKCSKLPKLNVIHDFFENSVDSVLCMLPRKPDLVICSGLLHEVLSAIGLLNTIRLVMGPTTRLHVNVPNSESLHRRLAVAMGLISDTKILSLRNKKLLQRRVYDMKSLKSDLIQTGLNVIEEGGYLIKPFTHEQMERILPELGGNMMDGLYDLGKLLPELASEIWVEAVLENQD